MSDMTPQELTALKLKFYDALVCDPKLSAMDLRIAWLLLSRYLNAKSLVAWPSAETLARDLGSSVRVVRRSIKRLTARGGWFTIKRGGGRRHSNVYSANFHRVTTRSPFARATGDTVSPLDAETVTTRSLNGDISVPETVTARSPESPLSKPIDEPFETGGARAENPGRTVQGFGNDKQEDARQGDRGGSNDLAQGHFLPQINGVNQPPRNQASALDWNGWAGWLQSDQSMTKEASWSWLLATLERIETERGVDSTEAGVILDRVLKRRRKAAA